MHTHLYSHSHCMSSGCSNFHTHAAVACCIDVFFPRTLIHPTLASSQMMLVDVFSHTGLLDYASVKVRYQRMGTHTHWMSDGAWNVSSVTFVTLFTIQACKLTKGKKWPLIMLLCTITAVVSAILVSIQCTDSAHIQHATIYCSDLSCIVRTSCTAFHMLLGIKCVQ